MPTIFVKDSYRAAVEAASGGHQTVLYDDKGFPSIMNVIPKFNMEDMDPALGTGVHPAFIKGGVQKSEIFVGTYPSIVADDRAVSMPMVPALGGKTFDQARTYCKNKGPGWHMLTNHEWAAIAIWLAKKGIKPNGNTNYGRSHKALYETGVREDGAAPGLTSGTPYTIPGSGPITWNHDQTANGIVDLIGNRSTWVDLLKLVDGRVYCPADNNFDLAEADWPAQNVFFDVSAAYSDDGVTQQYGYPILSDAIINRTGAPGVIGTYDDYTTVAWASLVNKAGFVTPALMKQLLIAPIEPAGVSDFSKMSEGTLYIRNNGERLPLRSGRCNGGSSAGAGCLSLGYPRSFQYGSIEFRVAFCL